MDMEKKRKGREGGFDRKMRVSRVIEVVVEKEGEKEGSSCGKEVKG